MPIKTFRDPIHGDIAVAPMQLAIIDSDVFQRLRYIRQNGLLHFVFPGAVHTRFAHSIGTMHIAQRVFGRLFPHYRPATEETATEPYPHARYIGTVFELAALLHDVGHCAFSHSIEKVDEENQGTPIFDRLESLAGFWSTPHNDLISWWKSKEPAINEYLHRTQATWVRKPQHEEIGLLLAYLAFHNPSILESDRSSSQAQRAFSRIFPNQSEASYTVEFDDLVNDVLSLMRGETEWLPPSQHMENCLKLLVAETPGRPAEVTRAHAHQLLTALHSLISGTLDVDRMDYLLRDSKFAGTVIGKYDLDLIVNSLSIRHSSKQDKIFLCISDRAKGAVDDFLWSRWQLYLQVINHKANVMLNALFARAFCVAVPNPKLMYFQKLLQFTDDWVMTTVRQEFLESTLAEHPALIPAKLAFLRNRLPKHLRAIDLNPTKSNDEDSEIAEIRRELAKHLNVPIDEIECTITSSDLIKEDAELPRIVRKELAANGAMRIQIFDNDSIAKGWKDLKRPTRVRRAHFFTQRRPNQVPEPSVHLTSAGADVGIRPESASTKKRRVAKPKL